jgi:hypothetical protein
MSRTTTSNSDGHALRACRDDIYQDELTKKIKGMADAINNLDFSKAADDPRAVRSIAIRNDRTGEILRPKERTETHTDIALREFGAQFKRKGFTDGYLTNEGEFLNRDQAWNRAREVGQRNLVRAQGRASGIMELHFRAI